MGDSSLKFLFTGSVYLHASGRLAKPQNQLPHIALPAFAFVLTFMGDSSLEIFIYWVGVFARFWAVGETSKLAAPHCAAGFRVRLNLHWRAPFVWNFFASFK